jgi:hypothetical protein
MKFENKKWVLNVALAGALSLGVASVAKADDSASAAPVFSVVAQELATQTFGTRTATSTTTNASTGDSLGFSLEHVQFGGSFGIDAIDNVTLKTELATGGLNLLDAYDVHSLGDLNNGLALKVGQFKIPFGANAYADPDKLIRTGYSVIDSLVPAGKTADGNFTSAVNFLNAPVFAGSNYDLGLELDQNFSDLTIQVAVVQAGYATAFAGTDKDYVGRIQWKGSNLTLGLSDYYAATAVGAVPNTANPNNLNTFGANASVNIDVVQLDLEAIFGSAGINGYTGTLSAKINGFQPAVWYEFTTANASNVPSTFNNMMSPDLGVGVNFWLAAKTRLAIDADFTGYSVGTTAPAGDMLAANSETVQLTESF